MKQVELICSGCGVVFFKQKKEYDRQNRKGKTDFYCTLGCFGKTVTPRLATSPQAIAWRQSERWKELQRQAAERQRRKADPFRVYMKLMKTHKGIVDIDLPYLKDLWVLQVGRCAYSGILMEHPAWTATDAFRTASVDRIDPEQGYVCGNIQFIIRALNWAKNSASDARFREFLGELAGGLTEARCIAK